jgi:hypothetical protein
VAGLAHLAGEGHVVQVEAVHHVEVAVGGQPGGNALVEHRLHVGRHGGQLEAAAAELHAGVALRTAFHAALAWQQQNVVVVEDVHLEAPG